MAVKKWLIEQQPGLADEIFLDLDPHTGIHPGMRWKQALQQANSRCEAVICLLSKHWIASHECETEFRYAETLNKPILCARLEPIPDTNITSEWQRCDLFVDGQGSTTEISIDSQEPVELSGDGLRRLLESLRALGIEAEYFPWPPSDDPDRAPYRGWAPLDEADAAVFFGRDAEIVRGLDLIRGMRTSGVQSLFVILGPSSSGKSSFLRAGLLPRLRRDDRRFLPIDVVRPERAVLTGERGFAQAVYRLRTGLGLGEPSLGQITAACLDSDVDRLDGWLAEARQAARALLLDLPADYPAPTLLLPLDQGEELFNADAGPQARRFLELLAGLLQARVGGSPSLIVVVTIRADRYEPLQVAPELAGIQSVVFDELKPLRPSGYKDVITGPARRATDADRRLTVEPALVERLLADSAEGADALPLLALTLERLYRDFGSDGDLTLGEYEMLGGLDRVVQTEIDTVLADDPIQRQAQLQVLHDAFIPWLATINPDNDQPMRRLARWDNLPVASHQLIDALVDKRLLVKDTRAGHTVVEVALESLLRQWRELAAWLREEAQDLKDADTLERAAADWLASSCDESWLLEGTRLTEAETLVTKQGFTDRLVPARDYLATSRTRENQRIEAEEQHRQAELKAARDKQEAAEALAAAETAAKEGAEHYAAALRKRSRILAAVLATTVVVLVVAVVGFVWAGRAERRATALRLIAEGQSMLAGQRSGSEIRALQQILAGYRLAPDRAEGALLDAVVQRLGVFKVFATAESENTQLAFSPDGQRVVSGGFDQTLQMWDAVTGKRIGGPMIGHIARVSALAFSPDGWRIASGSWDQTVRIWDVATGQAIGNPLKLLNGHRDSVTCVAFSPDGQRIASGYHDGTVRVWDVATGKAIDKQPTNRHTSSVARVVFSSDGQRIVSGGWDGTVQIWDATIEKRIEITADQHAVNDVAISPDGRRIVSAGKNGSVRIWDMATGQPLGRPLTGQHTGAVFSVAFSADGQRIVSGDGDGTLRTWEIWDAATGRQTGETLTGPAAVVAPVAVRPDGRIISGNDDGTVRIWEVNAGHPGRQLPGQIGELSDMAFFPDGQRVVSGDDRGTLRVWDATTGKVIGEPIAADQSGVNSVAVSPNDNGRRIVSGGTHGSVRVWDTATGQLIGGSRVGHTGKVHGVAFSPDGQRVVSGGEDNTVRLWDANTGQQIGQPIYGHKDAVRSVTWSLDGRRIVSGDQSGYIRIWDAATRQQIGALIDAAKAGAVYSATFSPDGRHIVSGSQDWTVRVWDANTGQPVRAPFTGHAGAVMSVAFSPDGQRIVSGSDDWTVRIWDAKTGQQIGQPIDSSAKVHTVAFSSDSRRIFSGSRNWTVAEWPGPAAWVDQLCAKLTANMSHQQWNEWVGGNIGYKTPCPGLPIVAAKPQ